MPLIDNEKELFDFLVDRARSTGPQLLRPTSFVNGIERFIDEVRELRPHAIPRDPFQPAHAIFCCGGRAGYEARRDQPGPRKACSEILEKFYLSEVGRSFNRLTIDKANDTLIHLLALEEAQHVEQANAGKWVVFRTTEHGAIELGTTIEMRRNRPL